MHYRYDIYGWFDGTSDDPGPRTTDLAPDNVSTTTTPGELRANWTGYEWLDVEYAEPPPPVEPEPEPRRVTKLAFRQRFTQPERVALEIAALDDPGAEMPVRAQAAALRSYLADVQSATFIDLERPDTRSGVQALEAGGLLAPGRAAEILDAEISAAEAWQ